jgi:ribosomal subunit interface protein
MLGNVNMKQLIRRVIMHIDIQAQNFSITEPLTAYVMRRVNFAFSSRYDQIIRINVRLLDINGPRGGVDKRCRIHINLPRIKDIVIEDTEPDLYTAIDRAMDRAGRTLNRRLERQYFKNRKVFIPHKQREALASNASLNTE